MNSSATWLHSPMRLAVLVFLSLGASLAVPGRSEAAFPGDNGRIAFTRPDAIWVVNADGTRERRLPDTAGAADPAWSPDGHRVAFTRNPSGAPDDLDIWVMDADGGHQMRLTIDPGADAEPAWSGDGQWIAFVRDSGDIWVRKADGTGIETNLTNAEVGSIGRPAWSPDGSEIAFAGVRDGDGGAPQIYVMNADGTGRRRLTDPVTSSFQFNTDPDWSPDGRQIAFVSGRDSVLSRNPEIYVMDADGGNQTRRTNDTAEDREPAWSPDGRQIAFSSSRDFASDVYLIPSGGGPALPLTTDGESLGETSSPSWQPEPVDDPPTISIDDPVVTEGDTGTKTVTFTLRRSRLAKPLFPDPVTVDWTTESEFAGAGSDFVPASGTATFDPGSLTTTVDVQINGDVLDEYDEIFNLRLSNPHSAAIDEDEGLGLGTVTIVDDDPEPSLSLGDARIVEGDAGTRTLTFTASLSAASGRPVTVDIATADGTATAPSDYTPTSATLTFDPGVTTRTFDVPITTDDAAEPDETFTVTLSHPGNATTSGGDATGTIEDDDGLAAGFTAVPNPASCGAPVSFDASGSTAGPGRSIASYEWDFGDGATGSGKQASHAYNAFGSYTAKLTVTDSTSHTDTRTTTVDQVNRDPVADAGGPYTVRPGTGVTLDASGSRDPNSPCGDSIGSYEWDLDGNGTYGEARGQSRTLTAAELAALGLDTGNHAIAVRVRDLHGGESTDTATLAADGPPLNDDFADAATLAAQGATAFDTSFATFEAGEPGMFSTYGSVWFTIAPGRGVMKLRTQTAFNSPTRDRRVAVYTGPEVGALSPLMIGSAAVDTNTSEVAFATKAGVTYSIQVSAPTGVADPFGAFHNGAGTLTPQFFAAPANDDFADATALGSTASFDTSFATGEPAERFPSPGPASVWFTIAPGRGVERLHAQAARTFERARRVAVYASSGIPGEFDAPVATGSTGLDGAVDVTFSTAAGVTYHVQVSGSVGWDGPSPLPEAIDPGRGAGTISTEFHAAPPNDDFAGATSITPGTPFGSVPFDTSFATLESGELLFGSGTVWFKIAPGHGVLRLRAPGGPFLVQSRLSVYAGSAIDALGPQIADASSTSPGNAEVAFPTSAGTTYHVRVTGPVAFSGLPLGGLALGIGTGTLVHEFHAAPANDDFADAATLAPTGETALDTSFASRETGEALSDAGTASVWFTIAPGRGAVTLRPRRGGSAFPGRVAVFVGTTLDALSPVVVGSIGGDVTFRTGAAVSYRVQVIGPTALAGSEPGTLDPSVGTGTLGYEFRAGPPNDDFADAVALGPGDTAFDTTLGTLEPGELSPFSASVWFTVAPGRGALKLSAVGANGAISTPRVTIYRGSSVGTLEPVASSSQSTVAFPTVAGVTYRIQVASPTAFDGSPLAPNSAPGAGTLSRQFFPAPPNDDFADAAALGAGGSGFDTSYATVEANEGDLTGDPGTVWYRMSPGLGTVSLHAEGTSGSSRPLAVSVYSGTGLGTLTRLRHVEASTSGTDVPSFATGCGASYAIRVRGPRAFEGGSFLPGIGEGTLTPTVNAVAAPPNDGFADAVALQPGHVGLPDQWWTCATAQASEPAHGGSPAAHSIWYRITPASGKVVLSSPGNRLAVYRGTSLTSLVPVPSATTGGDYSFLTPGGRTFLIALDGGSGTSLDYTLIPGDVGEIPIPGFPRISTSTATAPTAADPVVATLEHAPSLAAGSTIFDTQGVTAPTAWTFLGYKVEISAPALTIPNPQPPPDRLPDTQHPYTLTFYVHASLAASAPDVFRDGVAVPACAPATPTAANPDPCVVSRNQIGSPAQYFRIVVRTTRASEWTLGVPRTTAGSTLGVLRSAAGGDAAFGVSSNGKTVAGAFAYDKGGQHLVATSVTALAITRNTAWFAGVSTDKRPFLVYLEDNGSRTRDVFKLWIAGMEQTGTGSLKEGDLSVIRKP